MLQFVPIYYNLGLIFVVWAICPIGDNKILPPRFIAQIWEQGDIAKKELWWGKKHKWDIF